MSSLIRYYCLAVVIFLAILFYNVFFYVTYKADICKKEVPVDTTSKLKFDLIIFKRLQLPLEQPQLRVQLLTQQVRRTQLKY